MPDARFGVGNIPGGRYAPAAWTDKSGHCWMFGGYGYDSKGKFADFNDLWKYDLGSPGPTTITPTVTVTPASSTITRTQWSHRTFRLHIHREVIVPMSVRSSSRMF